MNNDARLLRQYAEEGSEAAFTELVRGHVDLVYGAALRRTGGDAHRAADVAQQVFTALAREARKLSRHPVLSAWLHTATRNAALNLMISEQRRQVRESEALALESTATDGGAAPDWGRMQPLLDAAIDELPESDRAAVVLRFLERRAFAEIGAALRVSEDAARMRTERALDKLRAALARRGITSTAAALGAVVTSQTLLAAPGGLAATLASQSLAAAGAGVFATFMTTKIITAAVLSVLVGFGAGSYAGLGRHADVPPPPPAEGPQLARTITSLRQDNQRLQAEIAAQSQDIARLNEANVQLAAKRAAPSPPAPVAKSATIGLARWEVQQAAMNNLRQIDAARAQYALEYGHPPGSINELVGRNKYIKTVRTVAGEDYSGLSMLLGAPLTVTTPDGITVTYDPSGTMTTRPEVPPEVARLQELEAKIQQPVNQALSAYRSAHNGGNPPNEQALLPYFATPKEGADFVEFLEARKAGGP